MVDCLTLLIATAAAFVYWLQLFAMNEATRDSTETRAVADMPFIQMDQFRPVRVRYANGPPDRYMVYESYKNTGESRADGVVLSWTWNPRPLPDAAAYENKIDLSKGGIPKQWGLSTQRVEIPDEYLKILQTPGGKIYVRSAFRYRDVFPDTRPAAPHEHLVRFDGYIMNFNKETITWTGPLYMDSCYDEGCGDEYKKLLIHP